MAIVTKNELVSYAQAHFDNLHYPAIATVLAISIDDAYETVFDKFLAVLNNVKTIESVAKINAKLCLVYLAIPTGFQSESKTIHSAIRDTFSQLRQRQPSTQAITKSSKVGISVVGHDAHNIKQATTHSVQATLEQTDSQRFTFFDSHLQTMIKRQIVLEELVTNAIENDEVKAVYQPIITTQQWQIIGYEVLSRFTSSAKLVASTRELIAVTEDLNLISELDLLTYHRALLELGTHLKSENGTFLNINISSNTRQNFSELFDCIKLLTEQYQWDHTRLVVDINPLREHSEHDNYSQHLNHITDKGTQIALADLSPGFDLGVKMSKTQVNFLRLDDRFYNKFHSHEEYYQVVKLLVTLCHDLGVKLIVEDVNSLEQARLLAFIGVDYLQGPYFTDPFYIDTLPNAQLNVEGAINRILGSVDDKSDSELNTAASYTLQISQRDLPHLDPSDNLKTAAAYFQSSDISILPVILDKKCVGIISRETLNLQLTATMGTDLETEKEARLWLKPINSFMQTKFYSVESSSTISETLSLISGNTQRLPVIISRQGNYVGILSMECLLRYFLQQS